MVAKTMSRIFGELNNPIEEAKQCSMLDTFCLVTWACADFFGIHPFLDGNGQTCHLLRNAITRRYAEILVPFGEGYPLSSVREHHQSRR